MSCAVRTVVLFATVRIPRSVYALFCVSVAYSEHRVLVAAFFRAFTEHSVSGLKRHHVLKCKGGIIMHSV